MGIASGKACGTTAIAASNLCIEWVTRGGKVSNAEIATIQPTDQASVLHSARRSSCVEGMLAAHTAITFRIATYPVSRALTRDDARSAPAYSFCKSAIAGSTMRASVCALQMRAASRWSVRPGTLYAVRARAAPLGRIMRIAPWRRRRCSPAMRQRAATGPRTRAALQSTRARNSRTGDQQHHPRRTAAQQRKRQQCERRRCEGDRVTKVLGPGPPLRPLHSIAARTEDLLLVHRRRADVIRRPHDHLA